MRREEEPGAYTLEEMDQFRWEQTFGKNFPIKAKHCDTIALVLIFAFAVWVVRWIVSRAREEVEFNEKLARAEDRKIRREEAAEKRAQLERIERLRLKRERLRRKPKIEVIEEDET